MPSLSDFEMRFSPSVSAAFGGIQREGLTTKTAAALARASAENTCDFSLKLSVLVSAIQAPPGGFCHRVAETVFTCAHEGKPLPENDAFRFELGMLATFADTCVKVFPSKLKMIAPLIASVNRDAEALAGTIQGGNAHVIH